MLPRDSQQLDERSQIEQLPMEVLTHIVNFLHDENVITSRKKAEEAFDAIYQTSRIFRDTIDANPEKFRFQHKVRYWGRTEKEKKYTKLFFKHIKENNVDGFKSDYKAFRASLVSIQRRRKIVEQMRAYIAGKIVMPLDFECENLVDEISEAQALLSQPEVFENRRTLFNLLSNRQEMLDYIYKVESEAIDNYVIANSDKTSEIEKLRSIQYSLAIFCLQPEEEIDKHSVYSEQDLTFFLKQAMWTRNQKLFAHLYEIYQQPKHKNLHVENFNLFIRAISYQNKSIIACMLRGKLIHAKEGFEDNRTMSPSDTNEYKNRIFKAVISTNNLNLMDLFRQYSFSLPDYETFLPDLIKDENTALIDKLLQMEADADSCNLHDSLALALENDREHIFNQLLNWSKGKQEVTFNKKEILIGVVKRQWLDACSYLVQSLDPQTFLTYVTREDLYPLLNAAVNKNKVELVKFLLEQEIFSLIEFDMIQFDPSIKNESTKMIKLAVLSYARIEMKEEKRLISNARRTLGVFHTNKKDNLRKAKFAMAMMALRKVILSNDDQAYLILVEHLNTLEGRDLKDIYEVVIDRETRSKISEAADKEVDEFEIIGASCSLPQASDMAILPDEMLLAIFQFLEEKDEVNFSSTSTSFRGVAIYSWIENAKAYIGKQDKIGSYEFFEDEKELVKRILSTISDNDIVGFKAAYEEIKDAKNPDKIRRALLDEKLFLGNKKTLRELLIFTRRDEMLEHIWLDLASYYRDLLNMRQVEEAQTPGYIQGFEIRKTIIKKAIEYGRSAEEIYNLITTNCQHVNQDPRAYLVLAMDYPMIFRYFYEKQLPLELTLRELLVFAKKVNKGQATLAILEKAIILSTAKFQPKKAGFFSKWNKKYSLEEFNAALQALSKVALDVNENAYRGLVPHYNVLISSDLAKIYTAVISKGTREQIHNIVIELKKGNQPSTSGS